MIIHPLRMYLLEEELVWAKRGLEQIVSALDNIQNNVKILWGEQILTHSFTPTVPGEKSEDELVENIGHVSELLRQGHIYLPVGSKRSDHCCLIHMYQFDDDFLSSTSNQQVLGVQFNKLAPTYKSHMARTQLMGHI